MSHQDIRRDTAEKYHFIEKHDRHRPMTFTESRPIKTSGSLDIQVSPLAVRWDWISLSSRAHRVGHSRALLFKSAMGLAATGNGGGFWHSVSGPYG